MKLTSTGHELLEHAVQVFALLDRAEERIVGLESEEVGRFVIGCHESLGAYFLPTFMRGFLEASPRIEVSLWNGTSAAVTEALVGAPGGLRPGGQSKAPIPTSCWCSSSTTRSTWWWPRGPCRRGRSEREAAHARLREGPLVYAGRVGQATELIERLAAESLLPTRRLSCGDLELVKSLALGGVGVALLPGAWRPTGRRASSCGCTPTCRSSPTSSASCTAPIHRTRASIRLKDALVAHGRTLDAADPTAESGQASPAETLYR